VTEDLDERPLLILAAIESGMSLRQAAEHVGVPAGTFLGWCDADADLAEHYARARERMLDLKAEELEEIGERAATAETAVEVAGLRLLSDNRKWLLSKLVPKKYGDKLQTEVSGPGGGPIPYQKIERVVVDPANPHA
jgi:transposase